MVFRLGLTVNLASVAFCTSAAVSPGAISSSRSPWGVTEMAYISVTSQGLRLDEIAPGLTAADVQKATEARLTVSPNLKTMES